MASVIFFGEFPLNTATKRPRASFGIEGLDSILHGGLPQASSCLLRGGPGTGKTTIGAHFIEEGVRRGESTLFVTLGEDQQSLMRNAAEVGISLKGVEFLDLSPSSEDFEKSDSPTLFSPAELERDEVTRLIVQKMNSARPQRVFLDSSSHLRLLSIDASQFRKQLQGLVRFLLSHNTTLLLSSESTPDSPDYESCHLCDSVIDLSLNDSWRCAEVLKVRNSSFRMGRHSLRLDENGCSVYPILLPQEHSTSFSADVQASEVPSIDAMLAGGLERGTTTVITGPSGVGKTTLSLQFAQAAARRGERAVVMSFEENRAGIAHRASALGFELDVRQNTEHFEIMSIEPLLVSTDEIAHIIRKEIEEKNCAFFVLDSIGGFELSVRSRQFLADLRSLLKYLTNMGVTVIAINETQTLTGDFRATENGISFLADNLIFLRYLEIQGEMRKAIGILKKRLSDFERHMREFAINSNGIEVGKPLVELRGILSGVPVWTKEVSLLSRQNL